MVVYRIVNATENCLHTLLFADDSNEMVLLEDCMLIVTLVKEELRVSSLLILLLSSALLISLYRLFCVWIKHKSRLFVYDRSGQAWFITGWACTLILLLLLLSNNEKASLKGGIAIACIAIIALLIIEVERHLAADAMAEEDAYILDEDDDENDDTCTCALDFSKLSLLKKNEKTLKQEEPHEVLKQPLVETYAGTKLARVV